MSGNVKNLTIKVTAFSHYVNNIGCSAGMLCGVLSGGKVENVQIILDNDVLSTGNDYLIESAEHDNLGYPNNIVSLGGIAGYAEGDVELSDIKVINNCGLSIFARPISDNSGNFYNVGGFIGRNNAANCKIMNAAYAGEGEISCLIATSRSQAVTSMAALIGICEQGSVTADGIIVKDDCKIVRAGRVGTDYIGYAIGCNYAGINIVGAYISDKVKLNAIGSDAEYSGAIIYPSENMSLNWDGDKLSLSGLEKQSITSSKLIYSLIFGEEECPLYDILITDKSEEIGQSQDVSIPRGNTVMASGKENCEIKLRYAESGVGVCELEFNGTSYFGKRKYDGNYPKVAVKLHAQDEIIEECGLFVCSKISKNVGEYVFKLADNSSKYDIIRLDSVKLAVDKDNAIIYILDLAADVAKIEIVKASASITFSKDFNMSIPYGSELNKDLIKENIEVSGFIDENPIYQVVAISDKGSNYFAGSNIGSYTLSIAEVDIKGGNILNYDVYTDTSVLNVVPIQLSGDWILPTDAVYNAEEYTAQFELNNDSKNSIFIGDNISNIMSVSYYRFIGDNYVLCSKPIDAGEYMAEIHIVDSNYTIESDTRGYFCIDKKSALLEISSKEIFYGDERKDILSKVNVKSEGFIFGADIKISIEGNADRVESIITLSVEEISCTDGADNYDCRISGCNSVVAARPILTHLNAASEIEYDSNTHEAALSVGGKGLVKGDSAILRYSKIVSGEYEDIDGLPVDAGEYVARLSGDIMGANYRLEEGSITDVEFTIKKKHVSYALPDINVEYATSSERIFTASYCDTVRNELDSFIYDTYDFNLSSNQYLIGASAGSIFDVNIDLDCVKSHNYIFDIVSGKMHVYSKHLDGYFIIDNAQNDTIIYDGKPKEYSFNITSKTYNNEHIDLIFEYFKDEILLQAPPIDSGNYKVRVYTDNANYNLDETLDFRVEKATLTINAMPSYTLQYDGQVRIADITCEIESTSSYVPDKSLVTIKVIGDKPLREVGEYDIEIYIRECVNYRADTAYSHVKIEPLNVAITLKGKANKIYDGEKVFAQDLKDILFDNSAGDTAVVLSDSKGNAVDYILNAGQYRVSASHSDKNYSGSAFVDYTVYKAERNISAQLFAVYGGVKVISDTDGKIKYSQDGEIWTDLPKDNIISLPLEIEYNISLRLEEDNNYLASLPKTLKAEMTIEVLNEYISDLLDMGYSEDNAALYDKIVQVDELIDGQKSQDYIDKLDELRSLYSNALPRSSVIIIALCSVAAVIAVTSVIVVFIIIRRKRNKLNIDL